MLPKDHILNQGRYRINIETGQDETGVIYESFDENSKTKVFLKEIIINSKKVISGVELEKQRDFFSSKARKLFELRHESLFYVYDFFSEIDRYYLVTEFAEGANLDKLLEKEKCSFALSNVLGWADQLLFALNYLHTQAKPIIHGNLKPQNLRLTADGKLKIFPLNILLNSEANSSANHSIDTAAISYLPLEQIWERLDTASQTVLAKSFDEQSEKLLRQPLDARSDLYSLAATVYHLSAGKPPVDALTRSIDLLEAKTDPLPPLCDLNAAVPREISDVLMKALEIKRENRFDSAVIMRQVLRTSVLRAKERQAGETRKQTAPPAAVRIAQTEEKRPLAKAVNSSNENVSTAEIELLRKRLREAEEEKLKAEQRAAEAEKLLFAQKAALEDQTTAKETTDFEEMPQISGDAVTVIETENAPTFEHSQKPETAQNASEFSNAGFNTLFVEPPKESRSMAKIAGAALVLALLGGVVWGIWHFTNLKDAGQTMQTDNIAPNQLQTVASEKTTAENARDSAPSPEKNAEPVTEKAAENPIDEAAPKVFETAAPSSETPKKPDAPEVSNPTAQPVKTKPSNAPADKTKKPAVATAKTPEPKKKAVTVEDLINGN